MSLEDIEKKIYDKAEFSFKTFFKRSWLVLEPETELLFNWHHELISEYLTGVLLGDVKRLIINIPPRYTKSNLVSVCFPVWAWISQPHLRFIFSSYSQSLSTKHSTDRRSLIESEWYQEGWKDRFTLASDQNVKTEFQNDKRGVMVATSMSGTATGKGANIIIIDDPHAAMQAQSQKFRVAAIESFDKTFTTRLDDKKNGAIIVIMQRLHEQDLTGHLMSKPGWELLKIPGIAERDEKYIFPLSKRTIIRKQNDLLHPERENIKEIEAQKKNLGSYGFAGQYQQNPAPMGGGILKTSWFKYYTEPPEKFDEVIMSWDLSFKKMEDSDFVVGQVWGKIGADRYLLDLSRDRLDFVETLSAFKRMADKWPNAFTKLVEEKANGAALINTLKNEISGIIPYTPNASKEARVFAVSPQIESGNVYLPKHAHWLDEFIHECAQFPNGSHDDQVDAMTQALLRFQEQKSGDWLDNDNEKVESSFGIQLQGDSW